ncbi:MAG: MBL fold metallo-hydrolase, partial [Planctomycetes bacterium]|nr:MBL fold metallo-hydrolase [Planctomycetota bacterium]
MSYQLAPPPERLTEFPGWADPPVRANTSASLLLGDEQGQVAGHMLIDAGGGVVDGLSGTPIPGLANVSAVLITHWHHDHISGLAQLGESLRRTARAQERPFLKIPLCCTLATFDALRERAGMRHVL